ncbi:DedA family protein [Streptomyces griseofuscus]
MSANKDGTQSNSPLAWDAAATTAAEAAYLLGRRRGSTLIGRYGRYVGLNPQRYARAEVFYLRHGIPIVLVSRFVDGLRQTNGLLAGANRLSHARFSAANAFGAAFWTMVWTALGYGAGPTSAPSITRPPRQACGAGTTGAVAFRIRITGVATSHSRLDPAHALRSARARRGPRPGSHRWRMNRTRVGPPGSIPEGRD